ncbi:cellulose biosynthesis protein BcsP [Orrella sp. JC864]|uniref:cellulose biosynthesis protein BcsP n=1 Tax=Orrella sp. JC864 TaxID=3120298 RepID=UPI00300BD0EE
MSNDRSDDISNLYERFGGSPEQYQEIGRGNEARASRERWPLLAAIDPGQACLPPAVEVTADPHPEPAPLAAFMPPRHAAGIAQGAQHAPEPAAAPRSDAAPVSVAPVEPPAVAAPPVVAPPVVAPPVVAPPVVAPPVAAPPVVAPPPVAPEPVAAEPAAAVAQPPAVEPPAVSAQPPAAAAPPQPAAATPLKRLFAKLAQGAEGSASNSFPNRP